MLKSLRKQLQKTGYRPVMDLDGELFLTRDYSNPELTYLSPERFIEELNALGKMIDPKTLKIGTIKKVPIKKPEKATENKKDGHVLPTWEAVTKMKYNDLKSFAADEKVDIPKKVLKKDLLALVKKELYS